MTNNFLKVKVLMLLPSLGVGGAEKVAVTYLRHLNYEIFDVTLLVIGNNEGKISGLLPKQINLKFLNKKNVTSALFAILSLVRREKPKLVFCNLSYLNLVVSLIKPFFPKSCKVIARESNIASINVNRSKNRFIHWVLYRFFLGKLDKIICQTKHMRDDLILNFGVSPNRIIVLPNPLDKLLVRKLSSDFSIKKPEVKTFVACGRLNRQKGFDILLDAVSQLKGKDFEVWILGEGELKFELELKKKNLGVKNVKFLGFKDNPFPYIKCADAFILSSRYEGTPNVMLEALALNVPILAVPTKGGGIEVLKDKKCGFVADGIDSLSLSRLMSNFLCGDLSLKVSEKTLSVYDANIVVKTLEIEMLELTK